MHDASAPATLSPSEEQERWLHEAFKAVKQHAFYMKRALVRPLPHCVPRPTPCPLAQS
jgi:hypothetical protein